MPECNWWLYRFHICEQVWKSAASGNSKQSSKLLPKFSCHTLRHTFATRLCESGVNMKVIQYATNELKQKEITTFSEYLNKLEEDNKTLPKESMVVDRIVSERSRKN